MTAGKMPTYPEIPGFANQSPCALFYSPLPITPRIKGRLIRVLQ